MGDNCFNFIFGEIIEERIAEENTFGFAYAGKCGVCFFGILAHIKFINVLDFYASVNCKFVYPAFKIFIPEGSDFIEEGENENRNDEGEQYR